jgi:aspartokinase
MLLKLHQTYLSYLNLLKKYVAQISSILETLKEDFSALDFRINEEYVKISLIGSGMRDMSGVASKAFITSPRH